jgi:two-component system nitrate/nitrite sensor histidine kinase NarX
MKQTSVITRINLAMSAIILMAISTILVSYWLSDQTDNDAYAINSAGSLRMHSYRLLIDPEAMNDNKEIIRGIFNNPIMKNVVRNAESTAFFNELSERGILLADKISDSETDDREKLKLVNAFVDDLNRLVLIIQHNAEGKIRTLRTFQIIAFFITVILSAIVIYWIHLRFTVPLSELTNTARQISRGDFSCNISPPEGTDELSVLSRSFEHMCKAISYMYESLEKQVEEKTAELQNSNKTLSFLYNLARRTSTHEIRKEDFNNILKELSVVTGIDNIELCLLTESGDIPYLQINGSKELDDDCRSRNCRDCLTQNTDIASQINFPISRENRDYGVLVLNSHPESLLRWQRDLFTSVANLFAIAMSLQGEEENIRRITLMKERNVIARELHDSLAQALSYLKIQVTRLNRAIGSSDFEIMMDVSAELKQGLDSAYRQLRELLTTFRLKVDGKGLLDALQKTVDQFHEQSSMEISLNYDIFNIPLSPQEEIHLLQIIREASQNAIHHSHGKNIRISLCSNDQQEVRLEIEDDGIGINTDPEKRNHYGMAIIQERAYQLSGNAKIKRRAEGGTGVYFSFTPESVRKSEPETGA